MRVCETGDKGDWKKNHTDMDGFFVHILYLILFTEVASNTHLLKTLQGGGCLGAALVNLLIERSREIEAQSVVLQVPVLQVVASASSKLKELDLKFHLRNPLEVDVSVFIVETNGVNLGPM